MSDFNINWDEEVPELAEFGPRVITDYGTLRYLGAKKVQLFVKDSKITFPDLIINGQPYSRGGMKEGHTQGGRNAVAHFFAYTGRAFTDDKPFTTVRMFTNMANIPVEADKLAGYPVIQLDEAQVKARDAGKTVWLSDWGNLQFPAMKSLPNEARQKLTKGEEVYFSADQWNTGAKPREDKEKTNEDGTPKKYYDHYWYNFTIYASEAEMLAARTAAKNGTAPLGVDDLPQEWVSNGGDREQLYADIRERYEKGQSFTTIVKKCDLSGSTVGNGEVDAQKLVAAALDTPVEVLESWFKA